MIDAAPMSSDVVVDLTARHAVIAKQSITIDPATKVSKVFTGDGNDRLIGDGADIILFAGRGDNFLDGGGGVDTAIFIGSRTGYTVTYRAPGTFTAETLSQGTSDIAVRIAKATFDEGTLYVQAASDTGLGIAALYDGLLFRSADAGGYRQRSCQPGRGKGLIFVSFRRLSGARQAAVEQLEG